MIWWLGDLRHPLNDAGVIAKLDLADLAQRHDEHLLDQVVGLEKTTQARAHANAHDAHDALEARAIALEQFVQRRVVTAAYAIDELHRMRELRKRARVRGGNAVDRIVHW